MVMLVMERARKLIVKRKIYPPKFGEWLKDSYNLRVSANYKLQGTSAKWSRRIFEHAREFVNTVKEVVKH